LPVLLDTNIYLAAMKSGRGAEAFKLRFTDTDPGLETAVLSRGAWGRAAVAAGSAVRTIRRAFRGRPRG